MEVAITQVRHQPQEALPQAPQPKTGKITGGNGNAGAGGLKVESQLTNGMTLQDQDTQRKYDDGRDLEVGMLSGKRTTYRLTTSRKMEHISV